MTTTSIPTHQYRTCPCGKTLSDRNTSGFCVRCFNQERNKDPAFRAARAEGIRRKFKDPEHRERMRKIMIRNAEKARSDPEFMKWLSDRGKVCAATQLRTPEAIAAFLATRKESGRKRSDTVLAWCPPEYRDDYRFLVRTKRLSARQAKAQILARVKADNLKSLARFHIEEAADFLRRFTSVRRQDEGWLYGTVILSPEQLIQRAQLRGWEPSKWGRAA